MRTRRLFSAILGVLLILVPAGILMSQGYYRTRLEETGPGGRNSWSIIAGDTTLALTYTRSVKDTLRQLNDSDSIRIISTSTADSATVVIYGILARDSTLGQNVLELSGTDTVWGTKKFLFVENAYADSAVHGQVKVVAKNKGLITVIEPGQTASRNAHHFTDKRGATLLGWAVEASQDTVYAQLRYYDDWTHSVTSTETGYRLLDDAIIEPTGLARRYRNYPPLGGWGLGVTGYVAVFAKGATTSANLEKAVLEGVDK